MNDLYGIKVKKEGKPEQKEMQKMLLIHIYTRDARIILVCKIIIERSKSRVSNDI